jgi:hypothetical protein
MGHPVPGGYKYGKLALQVGGVSQIETIKYRYDEYRAGEAQQEVKTTVPTARQKGRPTSTNPYMSETN